MFKVLLLGVLLDFNGLQTDTISIEYDYNSDPKVLYVRTDYIFDDGFEL